ncbi:MAG: response regulator transcription factor [Bacteroidota bacterium]
MKVLVIDDDTMMLQAIGHSLEGEGFSVLTAQNGMEALAMVESQKPDLIISDIMLPGMSGLTLLSMLKRFYFQKIPVIIISSLDKSDIILSSLGLGAVDFMVKPINFKELLLRVKRYIKGEAPGQL